eukprot:jgi/Psemu1/62667/estExt_Genemark1.C_60124
MIIYPRDWNRVMVASPHQETNSKQVLCSSFRKGSVLQATPSRPAKSLSFWTLSVLMSILSDLYWDA